MGVVEEELLLVQAVANIVSQKVLANAKRTEEDSFWESIRVSLRNETEFKIYRIDYLPLLWLVVVVVEVEVVVELLLVMVANTFE